MAASYQSCIKSLGHIMQKSWSFASRGGVSVLMSWPQGSKVKLSSSWVVNAAGPLCFGRQLEMELTVCVSQKKRLCLCACVLMFGYVWMFVCVCAEVWVTKTKCATYKDPLGQCGSIHQVKCFSDLPPRPHDSHTTTFITPQLLHPMVRNVEDKTLIHSIICISQFFK